MTTVDLTASEVGAKVILTDKLVRQSAANVMSIVGRQLGDGMARRKILTFMLCTQVLMAALLLVRLRPA